MENPQNGDDAAMAAMIGDWREDALSLDELLQTTSGQNRGNMTNTAIQSQAPSASGGGHNHQNAQQQYLSGGGRGVADEETIEKPTFSSSANRPSVLDLSTTVKVGIPPHYPMDNSMNNGHHSPHSPHHQQRAISPHSQPQQSPHSPHHSPYMNNQQTVFNYNNTPQQEQHSPVSPHAQQVRIICIGL